MSFVSVTRLRVRAWRYVPGFLLHALLAARQAKAAPGNLSVGLLRDAGHAFWTRTLWSDGGGHARLHAGGRASARDRRAMPGSLGRNDGVFNNAAGETRTAAVPARDGRP